MVVRLVILLSFFSLFVHVFVLMLALGGRMLNILFNLFYCLVLSVCPRAMGFSLLFVMLLSLIWWACFEFAVLLSFCDIDVLYFRAFVMLGVYHCFCESSMLCCLDLSL